MREKIVLFIGGLLFFISCSNAGKGTSIRIDLDQITDTIPYSEFVESIDYIELNTRDSCILSDIEKIYMDDDTFLIWDKKNAGLLVFDIQGRFLSQIDYYGEGPEEFITISAFCIDAQNNVIYIWDYPSQKIKKYTYSGAFLGSEASESFVRDFTILEDGNKLCILPFYSQYMPYGIWISDAVDNVIKKFDIQTPVNDQVEFSGTYYNIDKDSIFIYDRNYDHLYKIIGDSVVKIYTFHVEQALDRDLRKKDPASLLPFKDIAYMSNFSLSNNYLLQTYYYYNDTDHPYRWVLLDRNNGRLSICKHLINDIDFVQTEYPHIYYLDKHTWCRIVETEANNCNLLLQLLHVKD